jgi:hypothetical protein
MGRPLKHIFFIFILLPFIIKGQQVVEEVIPVDTSFITYKVIYKETVGDYFQLKRAVFADDTSVIAIEKNYSNGIQNGITRVFYPSGKLRIKAIYGNAKLQGEWTLYDENGIIDIKGVYNYGIKDGYWAYKSQKTYGRYSNGVKHRNWVKKDINNVKHKAFYWNGKKKSGSAIFEENYKTYSDTIFAASTTDSSSTNMNESKVPIDIKYINTFKHIAQNYYFRKAAKDYFRSSKKERAKFIDTYVDLEKDVFKIKIAPAIYPLDINPFLKSEKLEKPTLDSLLKVNGTTIQQTLINTPITEQIGFSRYSIDNNSAIVLYASEISNNLILINLVEYTEKYEEKALMEKPDTTTHKTLNMLFLFNQNNEIIEVLYQK